MYGEPFDNPVNEEAPIIGKSVYAVSKIMGEELCKAYSQRFPELSYVILRYFNTFGLYQTAQFVIPKFVANVLKDKPPIIYGDGNQKRSYSFASDVAWATIEALNSKKADRQIFNVGDGLRVLDLRELAQMVINIAGKEDKLEPVQRSDFRFTDRDEDREISERFCDSSKIREVLGFRIRVSLEEGLRLLMESGAIFERWETTELPYLQDEMV